jgi:UPF0755 protein
MGAKKAKKENKSRFHFIKKIIVVVLIIVIGTGAYTAYHFYKKIYRPNISLGQKDAFFNVKTGWELSDVSNSLYQNEYIIDRNSFEWVANRKKYHENIRPGKYLLKNKMSNNELVNLLRSGKQVPVKLTFNSIRTPHQLAGKVAKQIEADSTDIIKLLKSESFTSSYGFNKYTIMTMFIPNTYEVYWNMSAEDFFKRMANEYKNFWTEERKQKAKNINLMQSQVSILASVVQAEQSVHNDEKRIIAGLYINRLQKRMKLESDPTLVYAVGDFEIKRVLNIHKEVESPFNTYKYLGLPPGPINLPEISSIDAVLNYQPNNYIFMCAKEDFSGKHNFAVTYNEHLRNAERYRAALNKRKIMR